MDVSALLISPDQQVIAASRRALTTVGIGVEACPSSDAALKLLRSRKFEGIVVDADAVDGAELIKAVRAETTGKTAIVFAIVGGGTTMSKAFDLGATFVLEKPLSLDRTLRCFRAAHGLMIGERRRYFRHEVEIAAYLDLGGAASDTPATITDISSGGIRISSVPLKTEREVSFRFAIPGGSNIEGTGLVVWTEGDRSGLRLLKLSKRDRTALESYTAELMDSVTAAAARARGRKFSPELY